MQIMLTLNFMASTFVKMRNQIVFFLLVHWNFEYVFIPFFVVAWHKGIIRHHYKLSGNEGVFHFSKSLCNLI